VVFRLEGDRITEEFVCGYKLVGFGGSQGEFSELSGTLGRSFNLRQPLSRILPTFRFFSSSRLGREDGLSAVKTTEVECLRTKLSGPTTTPPSQSRLPNRVAKPIQIDHELLDIRKKPADAKRLADVNQFFGKRRTNHFWETVHRLSIGKFIVPVAESPVSSFHLVGNTTPSSGTDASEIGVGR
jgi:hypothetical protein